MLKSFWRILCIFFRNQNLIWVEQIWSKNCIDTGPFRQQLHRHPFGHLPVIDWQVTKRMSVHIARVCRNCYYQLRQIHRIKKSLSAKSKTLLVLVSVHSRLDYCNSVLYSLPWSQLQLLQSVLNSAARLILGLMRFDHVSPVLIDLHWLP